MDFPPPPPRTEGANQNDVFNNISFLFKKKKKEYSAKYCLIYLIYDFSRKTKKLRQPMAYQ
jgi:hypothetical protein